MDEKELRNLNRAFPGLKWVLDGGKAVSTDGRIEAGGASWRFSLIRFEVEKTTCGYSVVVLLLFGPTWIRSRSYVWKCKLPSTAVKHTYAQVVYVFGYQLSKTLEVLDNIVYGLKSEVRGPQNDQPTD